MLTVACLDDSIAEEAEHVHGDGAHGCFVIDDEDGGLPTGGRDGGGAVVFDGCLLFDLVRIEHARQEDAELAAAADFAVELDPAAVLAHDFLCGGESEAGAFAFRFCGEEGLEDASTEIFRDTVAVVTHSEQDEVGGIRAGSRGHGRQAVGDVFDGDFDDAFVSWQRVTGIEAEIEHDLLDLGGVGVDVGGIHAAAHLDGDTRIDTVLEEILHVSEQPLQVRGLAN